MKRLSLVPLLAAAVLATAATTQRRMSPFVTVPSKRIVKPGDTLVVAAVFVDASKVPPLASRNALFLVGLRWNPRRYKTHFVLPPIPIGKAAFKKVTRRGKTHLVASLKVQIPKMRLPKNFRLRFLVQGVAFVKGKKRTFPLPALPAAVLLRG